MSQSNPPKLEANLKLQEVLEPYFAKHHREKCYLGLYFTQGGREMIQINVPAHDLPILLQTKPSKNNDPDSGKNRPEVPGHAEEVKDYLLSRINRNKPWILGTFTANTDPDKIEILKLERGLCLLVIPRGVKLDITDGQHRKRAIHELIEGTECESIGENDFPITIVLEKSFEQCQTDFRDMAITRPLDKSLLLSFGEYEGRIGIVKKIVDRVVAFEGKTDKIHNTPSSKKKLIYTNSYISQMVNAIFPESLYLEAGTWDIQPISDILIQALNRFFLECEQTRYIAETNVADLTVEEIETFKKRCLLGTSVGLQILGALLSKTYDPEQNSFDSEKISAIANLDWNKKAALWQDNVIINDPSKPNNPYRVSTGMNPRRIAIIKAQSELGW